MQTHRTLSLTQQINFSIVHGIQILIVLHNERMTEQTKWIEEREQWKRYNNTEIIIFIFMNICIGRKREKRKAKNTEKITVGIVLL